MIKKTLLLLENNETKAIAAMKRAVDLEDQTSFAFGPPEVVKPSPELYGEFLLKKGDRKGAIAMFEKVLERAPKRRIATAHLEKLKALGLK